MRPARVRQLKRAPGSPARAGSTSGTVHPAQQRTENNKHDVKIVPFREGSPMTTSIGPGGLDGRVALVTGASSGLGRHFALTLARAGAKVAVAARRADKLRELRDEIESLGTRAAAVSIDVINSDSVSRAISTAAEPLGPVGILVNNAGVALTTG